MKYLLYIIPSLFTTNIVSQINIFAKETTYKNEKSNLKVSEYIVFEKYSNRFVRYTLNNETNMLENFSFGYSPPKDTSIRYMYNKKDEIVINSFITDTLAMVNYSISYHRNNSYIDLNKTTGIYNLRKLNDSLLFDPDKQQYYEDTSLVWEILPYKDYTLNSDSIIFEALNFQVRLLDSCIMGWYKIHPNTPKKYKYLIELYKKVVKIEEFTKESEKASIPEWHINQINRKIKFIYSNQEFEITSELINLTEDELLKIIQSLDSTSTVAKFPYYKALYIKTENEMYLKKCQIIYADWHNKYFN